jgi:hypothetical protein
MKRYLIVTILVTNLLSTAGCNEFEAKSEYAALQEVEYANRRTVISKAEIVKNHGYLIAGIRATGGKENIWILLNPKTHPYYKQIPQVNFTITHADLERIRQISAVSDTVIAVLETRVDSTKDDAAIDNGTTKPALSIAPQK